MVLVSKGAMLKTRGRPKRSARTQAQPQPVARGGEYLAIGLNQIAAEGLSSSPPPILPLFGRWGVDGSAYRDIPGLVWDQNLGMAVIGTFPVGGRLSLFLPAWQQITSDQFILGVVREDYSLPFVSPPPSARTPVETPLPHLRVKREALWKK